MKKRSLLRSFFIFIFLFLGIPLYFEFSFSFHQYEIVLPSSSNPDYWPITGWRTSSPEAQGMSTQKLNEMENFIENHNLENSIDSILIVRNGYLVYETYPNHGYTENTLHHLFSCTKVFTSALIGMAIEDGYIGGIDDRVLDYFPNRTFANMDSRKAIMTIKHLLTMTSGIEWSDNTDFYQMQVSANWVQYVLDKSMEFQPGTVWNYNSGGSHLLSAILEEVTPNGTRNYAIDKIFEPLNIQNYFWENDAQGIPIGGTLLYLTPRDMAKFGFLYLNGGVWNSTSLIPSTWVDESKIPYSSFEFEYGHGSGYGYQWWIYEWDNAYAARGSNQQHIYVIPDLSLIVVSTAHVEYSFISLLVDYILPSARGSQVILMILISIIILIGIASSFFMFKIYKAKKRNPLKLNELNLHLYRP